jgi:hypothetical protein
MVNRIVRKCSSPRIDCVYRFGLTAVLLRVEMKHVVDLFPRRPFYSVCREDAGACTMDN